MPLQKRRYKQTLLTFIPVPEWGTFFQSTTVFEQELLGTLKEESWLYSTQELSDFVEQMDCCYLCHIPHRMVQFSILSGLSFLRKALGKQ